MKSSRSRSRSKGSRNRPQQSGGNVVNRVFDSSGPEGKVRGTPQQIIEKYNQLARDAQLSNDRVAAENFQQHAEHYTRMLSEAQREIDSRREEQERQNRERQAERDRERAERQEREAAQVHHGGNGGGDQSAGDKPKGERKSRRGDGGDQQPRGSGDQPDVKHQQDTMDGDSNLVETPESKPKKPRAPRRKPRPSPETSSADGSGGDGGDTPKAAE
ncbi:DUF4167 domain-containing protein [Sulfitobacter sabulilitoris]|uniref:DUF4167 domain-containing protein n=1 Tax=Sulfitobacter sabulilitoris TaxID=2562655 RepID=A0A5S3PK49_9RHOB|nr:DUF4167 domain-containing protein [Sulfitobacter sabulilitoris]TMM54798.1 DUF4167 domain-containing protein [Sulfitobacter sabulilitoris]